MKIIYQKQDTQKHFLEANLIITIGGRIKIIRELRVRNISEWNINNALKQIDDKEYEKKLIKICDKQIQQISGSSSEIRNKVIRRLTQKGWETDLIIKCLNRPTK